MGEAERIDGLTKSETKYVECWRKYASEYSTPFEILRAVAIELGINEKTARSYRYAKKHIAEKIRAIPITGKPDFTPQKKAVDWTVNQIIAEYEKLLDAMPEDEYKERRAVLDSIKSTIKDFGDRVNKDLEEIKALTMEQLLEQLQDVATKLYGNKKVGEILRAVIEQGMSREHTTV